MSVCGFCETKTTLQPVFSHVGCAETPVSATFYDKACHISIILSCLMSDILQQVQVYSYQCRIRRIDALGEETVYSFY